MAVASPTSPERQLALLWGAVALALLALAPLAPALASWPLPCPLRALVGIPCPTCGATRAALALARLEPLAALSLNPLATVALVALVGGGIACAVGTLSGRVGWRPPARLGPAARVGVAAAVLANWLYLVWAGV
jgi:hypothetical protein